jgi:hypothetical protein
LRASNAGNSERSFEAAVTTIKWVIDLQLQFQQPNDREECANSTLVAAHSAYQLGS